MYKYDKSTTCCFTGYRPNHLSYGLDETHPLCEELKCVFADEINRAVGRGYTHFITGIASGTETWFAEVALFMKQILPAISLECVLPIIKQYELMTHDRNDRRAVIIRRCDRITLFENMCSERNRYMRSRCLVDRSSLIIGACNGLPGISRYLIDYARIQKLNIVVINPEKPTSIVMMHYE